MKIQFNFFGLERDVSAIIGKTATKKVARKSVVKTGASGLESSCLSGMFMSDERGGHDE